MSLILIINNKIGGITILRWSLISIIISLYRWIGEIIEEGTYKGEHSNKVRKRDI
jgi:Cytochrome c oxidase subunit III